MAQAIRSAAEVAIEIAEKEDKGFDEKTFLLGAYMKPGQTLTYKKNCFKDVDYTFVAAGDQDAEDVDVEVTDPQGRRVTLDQDEDSVAYADFVASQDGSYTIKVSLASNEESFVSVVMLADDTRWSHNPQNLVTAASDLLNTAATLDDIDGLVFAPNGWCLFGAVLATDEEFDVQGLTIEKDNWVVGACDAQSRDIDLRVQDNQRRDVVMDTEQDDYPLCFMPWQVRGARVTMRNSGEDASISMFAILTP